MFDKPESIWESPDLEILYNKMSSEYDLKIRFDILDKKIGYLSDISKMMMEFLAEKETLFGDGNNYSNYYRDWSLVLAPVFSSASIFV